MNSGQLIQIQKTIADSIEKNVNGKIRLLDQKIDDYIKSDENWKKQAEPVIQMGENVQGFGKVSLYIVGFVASVTAAIFAIIKLINNK